MTREMEHGEKQGPYGRADAYDEHLEWHHKNKQEATRLRGYARHERDRGNHEAGNKLSSIARLHDEIAGHHEDLMAHYEPDTNAARLSGKSYSLPEWQAKEKAGESRRNEEEKSDLARNG